MAWFKVDDKLHSSRKLMKIPRSHRLAALGLWTLAGSWSADQLTDGHVPEYMVEEWGGNQTLVDWLIKADLWQKVSDGSQFKNWAEYQPTKAEIEEGREKNREKLRKWRERNQGTNEDVTGLQEGSKPGSNPAPDPTRPDPTNIKELSSEIADAIPGRDDVTGLLDLLDTCLEQNGFKKPSRTKKNTDAARLLIDKDGYSREQVAWMIRWATNHEFWRTNILSMSKLREKFDQLKGQAGVGNGPKPAAGFNGEIDVDAILGRDVWTPGTPPAGLSVAEEIEWKKQQRANWQAQRLQEAKKKLGVAA